MGVGFQTEQTVRETVKDMPVEPGDHDKMAHYVPADKIPDAMIFGTPLLALCGKLWVPTRDGLKFPVCPECKEVYNNLAFD